MRTHIDTIRKAKLFKGIRKEQFLEMLEILDSQLKHYHANQIILTPGRHITRAGVLIEGSIQISHLNFWDIPEHVTTIQSGEMFLESYACSRGYISRLNITATTNCVVLWFNMDDILNFTTQQEARTIMARNLMYDLAIKNLQLTNQLKHVDQHTTKEKLLSYLSDQSQLNRAHEFDIPVDRQELANYLSVERSAMCAELSKLSKAGYFMYRKNHFILKKLSDNR